MFWKISVRVLATNMRELMVASLAWLDRRPLTGQFRANGSIYQPNALLPPGTSPKEGGHKRRLSTSPSLFIVSDPCQKIVIRFVPYLKIQLHFILYSLQNLGNLYK